MPPHAMTYRIWCCNLATAFVNNTTVLLFFSSFHLLAHGRKDDCTSVLNTGLFYQSAWEEPSCYFMRHNWNFHNRKKSLTSEWKDVSLFMWARLRSCLLLSVIQLWKSLRDLLSSHNHGIHFIHPVLLWSSGHGRLLLSPCVPGNCKWCFLNSSKRIHTISTSNYLRQGKTAKLFFFQWISLVDESKM